MCFVTYAQWKIRVCKIISSYWTYSKLFHIQVSRLIFVNQEREKMWLKFGNDLMNGQPLSVCLIVEATLAVIHSYLLMCCLEIWRTVLKWYLYKHTNEWNHCMFATSAPKVDKYSEAGHYCWIIKITVMNCISALGAFINTRYTVNQQQGELGELSECTVTDRPI